MSKMLMTLVGILPLLSATACVHDTTETAPRGLSDFCLVSKGISFSRIRPGQVEDAKNRYDTDQTAQAVEEHDLVYERLCPSKPAVSTPSR